MDPPRLSVDGTVSLVEALELPHPATALLRAFILDAVDWDLAAEHVRSRIGSREEAHRLVSDWIYVVEAVSSNGVELEAPDKTTVREIMERDGNYRVHPVSITLHDPIQLKGSMALLGDHSRAGIDKVDPRFVGTHARLCKSVQLVNLIQTMAPELHKRNDDLLATAPAATTAPLVRVISRRRPFSLAWLFSRPIFFIWRLIPQALRFSAYEKLMRFGDYWYGATGASGIVAKLPFGLFLKYSANIECVRNEFNALGVVGKNTGVPVPRGLDFASKWVQGNRELLPQGYHRSYMLTSELPGAALSLCMDAISDADYQRIQLQIQAYVSQIREIPQTVNPDFVICDTRGEACRDPRIRDFAPIGPFKDEAAFSQELRFPDEPSRRGHKIVFTHADLNPRNIIVNQVKDATGTLRWEVSGIVDWEAAGYYPEYWDCTKSMFERFRWPRRHNDTMQRVFAEFGDYSAELKLEIEAWESGDGV
ncbi:Protein kinase-like domain protein [Cordyceps fumosorosea ARSEF 2679]|uniref:Protein kinase-like domain protein n=1 Tax=Cordyceps fumosorosea (strain ARSEF 2679) TaxID=1081104 RepID=A0A166RU40_CORFA|nr:Protein kinase-like domain protein [Cordyceps fumosorosea ARSEF 2679]OAA33975.1 Protein kinase-like domain protein [Cordyceps fumosorosea ARSEF 2679]